MNVDWGHERYAPEDVALPGFPQSRWCLSATAARERFSEFPGIFGAISYCELVDINWHPAKRLDVCYRIGERVFTVRFLRPGESGHAYRKALDASGSCLHLKDISAIAWEFPADSDLPGLGHVAEGRHVPGFQPAEPATGSPVSATVLSYRRGNRCTMAFARHGGSHTIVGKMHRQAAAAHQRIVMLQQRVSGAYSIPAPMAMDPRWPVRWESFVPGIRLEKAIAVDPEQALAGLAAGLAALHRTRLPRLPRQTAGLTLNRMRAVALKRIGDAVPDLIPQCTAVLHALESPMLQRPRQLATLHGDLHTGNVLFANAVPVFIDLDDVAAGDAAFDLGMLASRLILLAVLEPARAPAYVGMVAALPRLYVKSGGLQVSMRSYVWYTAALLVARQAKTCINHAAPLLRIRVETLLRIAGLIAGSGDVDPARLVSALGQGTVGAETRAFHG